MKAFSHYVLLLATEISLKKTISTVVPYYTTQCISLHFTIDKRDWCLRLAGNPLGVVVLKGLLNVVGIANPVQQFSFGQRWHWH